MKEVDEAIKLIQHKIANTGYSQIKEILHQLVGRSMAEGIVPKINFQHPELELLIEKTTMKNPGQTYWSMKEVAEAIKLIQHQIANTEYSQIKEI
ncbi:MAG: hypothetical protein GTO45_09810, partial [Candidatus Aminicenantes bacterium]|nr:hypothetical protein [Candidatus Aminicenantes bacterium]NIN18388.1 hypothetical protein [Candidatus Aminicenantes bacterium]NIN42276.1 hypothetical protein [Candidatus Aminicenantes bacterium]NIN85042.1 hypothetical protein [Candidatus Aminicenantes bacterium]NIO81253.1 hypothetical protein [Candidatus Aminicenantes bacterium]